MSFKDQVLLKILDKHYPCYIWLDEERSLDEDEPYNNEEGREKPVFQREPMGLTGSEDSCYAHYGTYLKNMHPTTRV